ncbi:Cysteine and glycine-rich protein 1 [Entophlyctis sp. JEL0112]|nr:Cysteine and glycine-rich protein 1 [Entophlyctis sp. JEL0112]
MLTRGVLVFNIFVSHQQGFGFAQHTLDSTITDEQRFFPKDAPPQPSYAPSSDAGRISGAASEPPAPVPPSAVRTAAMFEAKAKLASAAVAAGGCPKCGKQVYFAEQIIGPGGVKYHKTCFRCTDCGKGLDATTLAEKDNVLFCKTCHTKKFGPKGYGFGVGAGTLAFTQ